MTEIIDDKDRKDVSSYKGIPAMTPPEVHKYLYKIGQTWSGFGCAVELGSWLGGSAAPLLEGLKEMSYDEPFWAFDRWIADESQVTKASIEGVRIQYRENTQPIFEENIKKIYRNVIMIQGNLPQTLNKYSKQPIEICLFDAPKQDPVFTDCIKALAPYWIPGLTILGFMDYSFYERKSGELRQKLRAPIDFIDRNHRCFEQLEDFKPYSPVFFRYINENLNI